MEQGRWNIIGRKIVHTS